jgi:hypothetical protein
MNKHIEALTHSQHKDLRLSKITSFAFAANISSVKLSLSELRKASLYYPIVFLKGNPTLPQALLSLEPGKNNFIDDKGNWKVPYIPAYFRLYPFTLAAIQNQEEKLALCIDPEAEHFKSGMGDPLFTADGELTEFVQKILKSLEVYQKEIALAQALFKSLDTQGLIVDRAYKYRVNQAEKSIQGFKGIDMKKLHAMDDKALAGYVKTGTMKMVYDVNDSLSNFSKFIAPVQK